MAALADKFAVNLKSERLRRKLSQEALAAKAGLSVSYISMLERGQRTPPLDTLESLAKALAVSPTPCAASSSRRLAPRRLARRPVHPGCTRSLMFPASRPRPERTTEWRAW